MRSVDHDMIGMPREAQDFASRMTPDEPVLPGPQVQQWNAKTSEFMAYIHTQRCQRPFPEHTDRQ